MSRPIPRRVLTPLPVALAGALACTAPAAITLPLAAEQSAGSPPLARVERVAWPMGTRLRIVVEAADAGTARRASEAALREIERLERVLGTWDDATEMASVNRAPVGEPVPVTAELAALLTEALAWSARTRGAFDPTLGPLVDAWSLRGAGRIPTPQEIAEALARSGPRAFEVDASRPSVRRAVDGAWIDTGGFGKGAALRAAARVLEACGVERALLDLGGQLWARAAEGEEPWPIGVAHPERRHDAVLDLAVAGVSVATSGPSERSLDVDGTRVGHILDPRTGRPAPAWGSVTIVSPDPVEADVLATALYVLGPEEGMAWAVEHTRAGVLFARTAAEGPVLSWTPAMERWLATAPPPSARGAATAPRRDADGDATAAKPPSHGAASAVPPGACGDPPATAPPTHGAARAPQP